MAVPCLLIHISACTALNVYTRPLSQKKISQFLTQSQSSLPPPPPPFPAMEKQSCKGKVPSWCSCSMKNQSQGVLHLKPPKLEHIFVALITCPPFFCADTFDTNLLLIVCALRWYVKCLYRHLFLEDTYKKSKGHAPWSTDGQIWFVAYQNT